MKLIIGLALENSLNEKCKNKLKIIIYILKKYIGVEVIVLAPLEFLYHNSVFNCKFITYIDDGSLFDFSRYNTMISSTQIKNEDILFAFNDTLGKGRKFNSGLLLYIIIVLLLMVNNKKKRYDIFSPIDSDLNGCWICPYFFIGRVDFLKTLNFNDWMAANKLISKSERRNLIEWLNLGWRHSDTASKEQKNIKFKTLILERKLLNINKHSNLTFMFSRFNIFRIINSLGI